MTLTSDELLADKIINFESKVESLEAMKSAIYDAISSIDNEQKFNSE